VRGKRSVVGVGLYGWDLWGFKDERLGDEGEEMRERKWRVRERRRKG